MKIVWTPSEAFRIMMFVPNMSLAYVKKNLQSDFHFETYIIEKNAFNNYTGY